MYSSSVAFANVASTNEVNDFSRLICIQFLHLFVDYLNVVKYFMFL